MAADKPLTHLALHAGSVADDLSFVALADLAVILAGTEHRVIGGQMVQLHVYRWGLGHELYRQTLDSDLGVPLQAAMDATLVSRLLDRGYEQVEGNRFVRPVDDMPINASGEQAGRREAVVDVLVPAYTSRPRSTRRVGDHLVTTEVPGLADAFQRPPVVVRLALTRLNDQRLSADLKIPDEASALALKVMAWRQRGASKDAVDVWRCSEIGLLAGVTANDLGGKTGAIVRKELQIAVSQRDGSLVAAIVKARNLSHDAGNALHTRLQAVVVRLTGKPS
jgi:hypothetical protein